MRISKKDKEETKNKIIEAAKTLFLKKGFEKSTTRDISKKAGLATGTIFNYFPVKESIAMEMIEEALASGRLNYLKRHTGKEELAEDLFLLISSELRELRPYQNFIGPVFEIAMSPFSKTKISNSDENVRLKHFEIAKEIISKHGYSKLPDFILLNLYWSLYLGIIAFWSNDRSYNYEETLSLIDYSLKIFVNTITLK
jgi:AcrR family transcriptional regulator